ncbi:hypothetical protein M408DRAFT_18943 [Serendipita vermifera MAFF 305830]|uniref:tRNA N(3)-methylcytidine methyltransferase n=1 Tax=Serendipita vermifera MAFF 305830 TaxID=933852 RepID=A0A0C3BR88_SERVB|nr:hypothetical protein M408DRAFT_18943 [Serendipita vermifera MAFF 305830]
MFSQNPNPKLNSSVKTPDSPPPFGSRFLTEDADVWSKNAWDHVPPPEGHDEIIEKALQRQRMKPVSELEKGATIEKYNAKPAKFWDRFYQWNENNFFKDRKWLHNEFPELVKVSASDAPATRIVEVGCGTGATSFPLLSISENPNLELFACDYSSKAIEVVKTNPLYTDPPAGKGTIRASVWDLSSAEGLPEGVEPGSVDIVVMIFVLSALHPREWTQAVANIYKMLKPGGLLLMRDYGRHDLAQIRFKEDRLLEDHLYVRGDGTRVYFFTIDEVSTLFTGTGYAAVLSPQRLEEEVEEDQGVDETEVGPLGKESTDAQSPTAEIELGSAEAPDPFSRRWISESTYPGCPPHPLFSVEQLGVDRRLIVNRKRQLKMYRVWIQGKFRKSLT